MGNIQRPDYNAKKGIDAHNPSWMKSVADSQKVCWMTIPGSHNTCSHYGGDLIQCQSLSLEKQLEAGIRFIDIRCRDYGDALPIHHGLKFQHHFFTPVVKDVVNFLTANPSEGILMSIKKEYKEEGKHKVDFATRVYNTLLSVAGEERFIDPLYQDPGTLTMGQLRGKICVIQRYAGKWAPGALDWEAVKVQDDWHVPTAFHINSTKIPNIKEHMNAARMATTTDLYINFLSGSSGGAYPYTVARSTNYAALQWMKHAGIIEAQDASWRGIANFGILVADFPGSEFIRRCIMQQSNWRKNHDQAFEPPTKKQRTI